MGCFVAAGAELQRTQVAPEGDVYTFGQIAGTAGVTTKSEDLSEAEAGDVLAAHCAVTNEMDEKSTVIKYDKHVASCVFSPDVLEALDSYMLKYREYGIVTVLEFMRLRKSSMRDMDALKKLLPEYVIKGPIESPRIWPKFKE